MKIDSINKNGFIAIFKDIAFRIYAFFVVLFAAASPLLTIAPIVYFFDINAGIVWPLIHYGYCFGLMAVLILFFSATIWNSN